VIKYKIASIRENIFSIVNFDLELREYEIRYNIIAQTDNSSESHTRILYIVFRFPRDRGTYLKMYIMRICIIL
jgi:hypothetical protein